MEPDSPAPADFSLQCIDFGAIRWASNQGSKSRTGFPREGWQRGLCPLSIGRGLVLVTGVYFCWPRQLVDLCQLFTQSKFRVIPQGKGLSFVTLGLWQSRLPWIELILPLGARTLLPVCSQAKLAQKNIKHFSFKIWDQKSPVSRDVLQRMVWGRWLLSIWKEEKVSPGSLFFPSEFRMLCDCMCVSVCPGTYYVPRLPLNSRRFTCLLSAGTKGECHRTWLELTETYVPPEASGELRPKTCTTTPGFAPSTFKVITALQLGLRTKGSDWQQQAPFCRPDVE